MAMLLPRDSSHAVLPQRCAFDGAHFFPVGERREMPTLPAPPPDRRPPAVFVPAPVIPATFAELCGP